MPSDAFAAVLPTHDLRPMCKAAWPGHNAYILSLREQAVGRSGRVAGAVLGLLVVAAVNAAPPSSGIKAGTDFASTTQGLQHTAGFFEVYRDDAKGHILLGVHAFEQPFLMMSSLPWALGSNDVGLDRGQSSESHLVEFRRVGARVLLVEDNTKFRAVSSHPDEALSVRQEFAE